MRHLCIARDSIRTSKQVRAHRTRSWKTDSHFPIVRCNRCTSMSLVSRHTGACTLEIWAIFPLPDGLWNHTAIHLLLSRALKNGWLVASLAMMVNCLWGHLVAHIITERLLEWVIWAQLDCLLASDLVGRGMKAMLIWLTMLCQISSWLYVFIYALINQLLRDIQSWCCFLSGHIWINFLIEILLL